MFAIASCRLLVCGYVPLFLCGHGPRHTPSQTVMNFKRYVIRNGYVLGCGGFFLCVFNDWFCSSLLAVASPREKWKSASTALSWEALRQGQSNTTGGCEIIVSRDSLYL